MPAGTYYLKIDGVGANDPVTNGYSDYGSIGQYTLDGSIPSAGAPVVIANASPATGMVPLTVQLSSAGSYDADGGNVTFSWSSSDGFASTDPNPVLVCVTPGIRTVTLTVTDDEGMSAVTTLQLNAQDTPPAAPTALSAVAVSSSQINLTWADNSSNESGFRVERSTDGINFTEIATVGVGVTSFSNTGLASSTAYSYRVRAYNESGNSTFAGPVSASTPASVPAAPSKLTARAASQTQINLTWLDNAGNETGYYVERSLTGSGGWTRIASLAANSKAFNDAGLTRNTRYYYRVQANGSAGVSPYSATANTTTKR
jgi:PKD repeat protein